MTSLPPTKMERLSSSLSQQENGIKSILTSTRQMTTSTWTEQTKSSWLDWEQDTTGWMLKGTVNSRLARQSLSLWQPQWLASTCSKTAHAMMLSGKKHGYKTPLWGTSSLVTRRLCGGQLQASPSSVRRSNALAQEEIYRLMLEPESPASEGLAEQNGDVHSNKRHFVTEGGLFLIHGPI